MSIQEVRQLRLEKLLKAQEIRKACELFTERLMIYQNDPTGTPTSRLNGFINRVDLVDTFKREFTETFEVLSKEYEEIKLFLRDAETASKGEG